MRENFYPALSDGLQAKEVLLQVKKQKALRERFSLGAEKGPTDVDLVQPMRAGSLLSATGGKASR